MRGWVRAARYMSGLSLEAYKDLSWRRRHLVHASLDEIIEAENAPAPKT